MSALTIPSLSLPAMTPRQLDTMHEYEAALLERPQVDIPTAHLIHAGMYARTILIPAGVEISGALMRIATVLIVSGHARVNTGDDVVTLKGYGVLPGSAGRKQAFLAIEDTMLTMLFPTRAKTVSKADRTYQRELLQTLAESYPQSHDMRDQIRALEGDAEKRYAANLVYLEEHGLAESAIKFGIDGHMSCGMPRITAKGMDFLADDGGLSAIPGVVTIKFHDETLKALIGQKIQESDLAPADKSKWLDALRELPGEAIKHLTLKLVDAGLANWPVALQAIQTFMTHHGT